MAIINEKVQKLGEFMYFTFRFSVLPFWAEGYLTFCSSFWTLDFYGRHQWTELVCL